MDQDKGYGGCEGPDAMYVKLISSDGHDFFVKREHALTSGTIKGKPRMMSRRIWRTDDKVSFSDVVRTGPVRREWSQRGQLQGNSVRKAELAGVTKSEFWFIQQFPCPTEGLHVLHLQSPLHQLEHRDPRVPHCSRNRVRHLTTSCKLRKLIQSIIPVSGSNSWWLLTS